MKRSLTPFIEKDLASKFVFVGGPRQVGKTYLATHLLEAGGKYYNWDSAEDREKILTSQFVHDGLVVLDEIHKYEPWKNFLKGIFDKHHEHLRVLVTGSARMDIYRRGGDSLFGRHYHYRLHPLSLGEIASPDSIPRPEAFDHGEFEEVPGTAEILGGLLNFGGFPDPFLKANADSHRRWLAQRRELLVREDIRDLTQIHMLGLVEHLMILLGHHASSLLSINALKEDLRVSYQTVAQWLAAFERLYISYSLPPFVRQIRRGLQKATKLYLWDWSQVENEGARFENLMASHLLKAVQFWHDLGYANCELFFIRDRERREVDFCVTKERKPWFLVEAKLADEQPGEPLQFFSRKFGIPAYQVIAKNGVHRRAGPIRVVSANRWLCRLP